MVNRMFVIEHFYFTGRLVNIVEGLCVYVWVRYFFKQKKKTLKKQKAFF